MRLPVKQAAALLALSIAGLAGAPQARTAQATHLPAPTGPAADYPVVVGEPYTIGSTTWTPADQLNYDAVGHAGTAAALTGVSAAHKTLPLPSYAEVTALETGRTILVRIVERGPQDNDTLIALSEVAVAQLGLKSGARADVRVRRVNPPEVERAALRTGGTAPLRMPTPESLLKVLRRKLAEQSPLMPPPSMPPRMPTSLEDASTSSTTLPPRMPQRTPGPAAMPKVAAEPRAGLREPASAPAKLSSMKSPTPAAAPTRKTEPKKTAPSQAAKAAPAPSARGSHVVQVAAFSTRDRADKAARQLGGAVVSAGRFWRVRLGPFATDKEASSALGKAKAAGYSDARIQRPD